MLNQLSALPDFSSTCSHKPTAVGSLTAVAAQAAEFNAITAPIVIEISSFIATSYVVVPPATFMAGDCGDLSARSTSKQKPPEERSGGSKLGSARRSDYILSQRRIAVEADRRIGRRVRAGCFDQHLVADGERDGQRVGTLFVEHIHAVACRPRDDAGRHLVAIARGA